jgi:hypothetical protein
MRFLPLKNEKEPWQIMAARFCANTETGLTEDALRAFIIKNYPNVPPAHISFFYEEEIVCPSGRQYPRGAIAINNVQMRSAPMELVSKITDYEELKEARKNAASAFWMSFVSIIIALLSLLVSILKS